ncbi:hypothetical protein Tco_1443875 [Tanacetum coccineum]
MAPLLPRDQRHLWLCYQVEGYTEEIVLDFEQRLETIFRRQVNRVHILNFEGLTPDMRQDLAKRLRMVYTGDDGQEIFLGGTRRSMTWRQFILALGLHTTKEMAEGGFEAYWLGSERVIPDKGDAAEKVTTTDLFYLRSMDRWAANVPYLLAQYLFRHAERKKSGARLLGGHFIRRLAYHFCLVSDDGLRGLSVGVERQPITVAAAPRGAEDAPNVDEGAQAVPTPIHAPLPPPPSAGRTMPQRLGRLEEEMQGLRQDVRSLRGLVERSMTDQGRFSTWMVSSIKQLIEVSGRTYHAFDGTFQGSYLEVFERRTRHMTDGACTSTAQ